VVTHWIRIFPDKPNLAKKPTESHKATAEQSWNYYVAEEFQPGKVLYEINGVPEGWHAKHSGWRLPSCCCAVAPEVGA
jgi:ribosomal protein L16/L10AE